MKLTRHIWLSLFIAAVVMGGNAYGQLERDVPLRQPVDYGPKFFDQLRHMSERLRQRGLHRVFQMARPIECSELADNDGEWRHVAFFSENRKFRDWYRTSLDEVKNDLATYIFKGACRNKTATLEVTTTVPVDESVKAYQEGRIDFSEIRIKVNAPVRASFVRDNQAYTFELPYLFRGRDQNGGAVYTFNPRNLSDRYVTNVTSRWVCKAVNMEDVTYQFLICHTMLMGHDPVDIKITSRDRSAVSFGASAYSILSDGKARKDR